MLMADSAVLAQILSTAPGAAAAPQMHETQAVATGHLGGSAARSASPRSPLSDRPRGLRALLPGARLTQVCGTPGVWRTRPGPAALRSPLAAQPLREPRSPGSAPLPCTQRRARGRGDSRGQGRRGREEARGLSSGSARAPWPTSPRSHGARQSRDGARGCLTAGRKARGLGTTGRPCASLAEDGRRGGRTARAGTGARSVAAAIQAAAHSGHRRAGRRSRCGADT